MPARRTTRARRPRAIAALTVAMVLSAAGCSSDDVLSSGPAAGRDGVAEPSTGVVTTTPASVTSPPATTSTTTTSTTTTSTTTTLPPLPDPSFHLQRGDEGEAVVAVEQLLAANGYWLPGADDGVFDEHTVHAVTAVQKTHGLPRTGVVDYDTLLVVGAPKPPPRSTAGVVMEVDIDRQVTLVVRDGTIAEVFDSSTGRRAGWTPRGEYAITRQIDGIRNAPLGRLYRPKYFVGGVAFHGYPKVPAEPASHGCVRVTNAVMDHIWDTDLMPKGTPVWVY